MSAPALLVLCLASAGVGASDGRLRVEVPSQPVLLGQWFELVVSGELAADARLLVEAPSEDVLLGRQSLQDEDGSLVLRQAVCVAREGPRRFEHLAVRSGDETIVLPPVEVDVVLDIAPNRLPRVASLREPVAVPLPPARTGVFFAFAVLALLGLGLVVVRAGRVVEVVVPPRPPDLVAAEALARLRLSPPHPGEDVLAFILKVGDVLRTYIEGRFAIHAPARTTEEFLAEAASRHDAVSERTGTLERFLSACDLVKFARHRPAPTEAVGLLDVAEAFVEETRG